MGPHPRSRRSDRALAVSAPASPGDERIGRRWKEAAAAATAEAAAATAHLSLPIGAAGLASARIVRNARRIVYPGAPTA
jgi:hypothetical protein